VNLNLRVFTFWLLVVLAVFAVDAVRSVHLVDRVANHLEDLF